MKPIARIDHRQDRRRSAVIAALALTLAVVLMLTGCVNIAGTRTAPDGTKLSISANRFLWMSQQVEFTTKDASGVSVGLKVGNSRPDVEAINALANIAGQAAGQAAAAAAKP